MYHEHYSMKTLMDYMHSLLTNQITGLEVLVDLYVAVFAEDVVLSLDKENFIKFILTINQSACLIIASPSLPPSSAPAIINPCVDTVTEVSGGFIRYFQAECNTFSDTVVVELMDTSGTNYLYCSTVETNPGPLTDSTTADETMGVSTRTCTVDLSGSDEVSNVTSYSLVIRDGLVHMHLGCQLNHYLLRDVEG